MSEAESLRVVPKDLSEIAKAIGLGEVAPEDAETIRDCASAWRTALARLEAAERHKHTDACLEYAAKTGRAFCIAECADSRAALAREKTPNAGQR